MIVQEQTTDFNDTFGGAADGAPVPTDGLELDPMIWLYGLGFLGLAGLILWGAYKIGCWHAEQGLNKDKEKSINRIYTSISYYLDKALKTPGAGMIQASKVLVADIDARLKAVFDLKSSSFKALDALKKVLAEKPDPNGTLAQAANKPEVKTIKVAKSTQEHQDDVWIALLAFQAIWKDEAKIKVLLRDALDELTHIDGLVQAKARFVHFNPPTPPKGAPIKPKPSTKAGDQVNDASPKETISQEAPKSPKPQSEPIAKAEPRPSQTVAPITPPVTVNPVEASQVPSNSASVANEASEKPAREHRAEAAPSGSNDDPIGPFKSKWKKREAPGLGLGRVDAEALGVHI